MWHLPVHTCCMFRTVKVTYSQLSSTVQDSRLICLFRTVWSVNSFLTLNRSPIWTFSLCWHPYLLLNFTVICVLLNIKRALKGFDLRHIRYACLFDFEGGGGWWVEACLQKCSPIHSQLSSSQITYLKLYVGLKGVHVYFVKSLSFE
jgi:hypothetical protein